MEDDTAGKVQHPFLSIFIKKTFLIIGRLQKSGGQKINLFLLLLKKFS